MNVIAALLLILILLIGGYFRFVGLNWDDFIHFHPDERFLTSVATSLGRPLSPVFMSTGTPEANQAQYERCLARYPETQGEGGYFDAECSTWNPHNVGYGLYVYGHLPLFLARLAAEATVTYTGDATYLSYEGLHLAWRGMSAAADWLAILIVFAIGLQLHGKWAGVIAAALYAFAVFPIQQAHFGTADALTNLFVVLALWFAVRVQLKGRLLDYALFGVAFGAALAGRINVAPLVGLIVLAAIVRNLPLLDSTIAEGEGRRAMTRTMVGLLLAGALTLVVFRIGNPYAFTGPGFFGLTPNQAWLADMAEAQRLVSGAVEMPPNWQWVGRPAYLFPFSNMVLWGMGIAFGLASWLAWGWALWRIVRGKPGAILNLLLVLWVLVYFGWLGRQWVMTMRYYLPLYPAMAVLAGWGLTQLARGAKVRPARRILAGAVTVLVVGLTGLWAGMFTNIYRHQSTMAQAAAWVWENVPGDFAMTIEGAPDDTPLINIAFPHGFGATEGDLLSQANQYIDGQVYFYDFTAPASGTVTTVHAPHLGDPQDDSEEESIRVSIAAQGSEEPLTSGTLTANLVRESNVLGEPYDIPLDEPLEVEQGQTYTFRVEVLSGGPVVSGGATMAWEGDWDEPVPSKICALPPGVTLADDPPPGMFTATTCRGIDAWSSLINGYKLQIIYDDVDAKRTLMQTALDNSDYLIIGTNRRYDSQSRMPDRWPMTLRYYDALFDGRLGFELVALFQETFELGPLRVSDQHLPIYDSPAWLNEFEAEEAFHVYDHPVVFIFKKTDAYSPENTAAILGGVPLSGFGPIHFSCPEAQNLPVSGFYCDPTLVGPSPIRIEGLDVSQAVDEAPTGLRFPQDMRDTQYENGTWINRFQPDSIVNSEPVLTVVLWWMAVLLIGWAAWPLLFAVLPGLADRGYGFAKIVGLFLTGWLAWLAASARIPAWSQLGVLAALLIVGAFGVWTATRCHGGLIAYVQEHWRRLLAIEAITLILFVFFLGVRMTNPDLWHPGYGGEKPMDFAYFNGVLRSTIFPPVDPWYAGGYINYYYFGYVIVGVPVLLLGVVPSVAYNLIIPTLFALTGIGAFSAAFNTVAGWRERRLTMDSDARRGAWPGRFGNPWTAGIAALLLAVVLGNLDTPRIILGQLAEIGGYREPLGLEDYLASSYVAQTGEEPTGDALLEIQNRALNASLQDRIGYELWNFGKALEGTVAGAQRLMTGQPLGVSPDRWFWGPTRVLAEPPVSSGNAIAEMPYFTFLYGDLHAHMIAMPLQLFVMAFLLNEVLLAEHEPRRRLIQAIGIALGGLVTGMLRATNTWDWLTYTALGVAGMAFVWWLRWRTRGRIERGESAQIAMLALGLLLLTAGVLIYLATQTLSTAALVAFGIAGVAILWVLFWNVVTRRSLIDFIARVGGFAAAGFLLSAPYTSWFAATYNSALPWDGPRTPLWAYFDIHGLFLFLVFTLLVWDTARWFRSVYVRSLRGRGTTLLMAFAILAVIIAGAIVLAAESYQVALVAIPMIVWIALLFFRAGQSRSMQFVLALSGLALALTLAVEFVTLAGDIGRQNTVFKFYIQVWLLFSVAGGAAFAWLWRGSAFWRAWARAVWLLALFVLVFAAALFPILATPGKASFRMAPDMPPTIDGMAYMQYATQFEGDPTVLTMNSGVAPFPLADDYALIRWMQENIEGTPVIMEGRSEREYLWGSRVSIYTGLPSVVGWNWHQRQQRTFDPLPRLVEQRVANVNAFYVTQDIETAWRILRYYDVRYVVVSGLERAYYPPESLEKFERMVDLGLLDVAFQEGGATVYQVNQDATFNTVSELAGLDRS